MSEKSYNIITDGENVKIGIHKFDNVKLLTSVVKANRDAYKCVMNPSINNPIIGVLYGYEMVFEIVDETDCVLIQCYYFDVTRQKLGSMIDKMREQFKSETKFGLYQSKYHPEKIIIEVYI